MRSEKGSGNANVVDLAVFRRTGRVPVRAPHPRVYSHIDDTNTIHYGMQDVSATESIRLLRAVLMLGIRLLDIYAS